MVVVAEVMGRLMRFLRRKERMGLYRTEWEDRNYRLVDNARTADAERNQ